MAIPDLKVALDKAAPRSHPRNRLRLLVRRSDFGAFITAVTIFVIFAVTTPHFLSLESVTSMLLVAAELGIVAMGITLLMIAGEFDLSVGSVLGASAVAVPFLVMQTGMPTTAAIVLALAAALAMGAVHATIVLYGGIASFIVTLGGLLFWRSIVHLVTQGFPVSVDRDDPVFWIFSNRFDSGWNMSFVWFVLVALVLHFVLSRTMFGNWVFATGGDERAARTVGVPVIRVKYILFMLASFCAFLAGLIQTGRFASVDANRGAGIELEAIAAVVIGGTSLKGGVGSILGTVFGILTVGMIRHGLALSGMTSYIFSGVIGLLIVVAVMFNHWIHVRARRRA